MKCYTLRHIVHLRSTRMQDPSIHTEYATPIISAQMGIINYSSVSFGTGWIDGGKRSLYVVPVMYFMQ